MSLTNEQQELINSLDDISMLLEKTQTNLKKCPKSRLTKGYLQAKIQCIEDYWKTYLSTHQSLAKCTPKSKRTEISHFKNDDYFAVEELYSNLIGDLKDMLHTLSECRSTSSSANKTDNSNQAVKLPRIELKSFTGSYDDWPTYRDLFTSLVHDNASLSKVQKLHYLKSSVSGEPETLLKHITVCESNYEQAWDVLTQRYGNKRLIVHSLLQKLFNQKKLNSPSAPLLKNLLDTTCQCLNSLKNQEIPTGDWDQLIIYLVVQRLDVDTHKHWQEYSYKADSNTLCSFDELKTFLETKFRTLEMVNPIPIKEKAVIKAKTYHATSTEESSSSRKSCSMCHADHSLCHCKEFCTMQPIERSEFIKKNRLCFNCLTPGHAVRNCRNKMSCRKCNRRHHTLLHEPRKGGQSDNTHHSQVEEEPCLAQESEPEIALSTHFASEKSTALLATAMVTVRDDTGHTTVLRALVDQGSQGNFITERAVQLLKIKKTSVNATITGVGDNSTTVEKMVRVDIGSRYDGDFKLVVDAYVMPTKLTSLLPSTTITTTAHAWTHLRGLTLADPSFHSPGRVDMLLGVEVCAQILKAEILKGPPGSPCAQNTSLGWILFGKIQAHTPKREVVVMHHQCSLDDMLKIMWEVDTDSKQKLTREEKESERIYKDTTKRDETGRYIVKLPFKVQEPRSPDGNTKEGAMKRLIQLEKRFAKNENFKKKYTKAMNEYLEMQFVEEIHETEINNPAVYLPHHAVLKETSETTKLRPVFDASYKGTNNISLNDELLVGPQLQDDVRSLVMRWRLKKVAFTSDIQKMYLQILVAKEDTDFQRILWRSKSNETVKEYRLLRVTFGTASAPFLAVRTLHQLADDEGVNHDSAADVIKNDFFMDDLMCSKDTVEEAVAVAKELSSILQRGGFTLQKWASNNAEFLKEFSPDELSSHVNIDIKVDGSIKALGLSWNMGTDQLEYKLNLSDSPQVLTKRKILSEVQRLFDALGWLAPALVPAKLIIQKLWLQRIGWDDEINPEIRQEWTRIRENLNNVNLIKVKRWLEASNERELTIHGYCDASEKAYAAVAYLRVRTEDGEYKTNIIAARTKVAPIKALSLPRLELSGAVLLSKLLNQISEAMRIPKDQIFCWTDSTIVLSWLKGDPNRWHTFVQNRVITILENIGNKWYHIQSQHNPADIASRGTLASELKSCDIWWHGPERLKHKEIDMEILVDENLDLERKIISHTYLNVDEDCKDNSIAEKFEKFRDLTELLRTITYAKRFLFYRKGNIEDTTLKSAITTVEIENSLKICIKIIQEKAFAEEIKDLQEKKKVKNRSLLKTLNPYLDSEAILRVGGRIKHADIDHERKHPIILDNKNSLTSLLIADAHKRTLHGGIQLMLNYLRSRYWILKVRNLVKKHVHKCLVCARINAKTQTQLMGELPKVRLTPARPFLHSGVDFSGPYDVLMSRGRGGKTTKSYIAIFVCMATKAIHLELVGDLTTESFLGAFRRFVARRGRCSHLWSDQGRNFIGANKELAEAFHAAQLEFGHEIFEKLSSDGTQWHFIPAYSPNFGGLWEAGVRSMKYHLKRILSTHLTFEEMTTVLCQVESCLNSRPLYPVDDSDVNNTDVLTPGHFLIGEPLVSIPSPSLQEVSASNLTRWQHTQKLVTHFWRRWQEEYLTRLQQRPKWMSRQTEFDVGQIVLIKTDGLPPGKWHLGRVVNEHPGPDGLTRVYSVKSGNHVVKRSISKLCPIPIKSDLDLVQNSA